MSRVYIPNISERYDAVLGRKVPAYDYSAAAAFGALTPVLEYDDNPALIARVTSKVVERLSAFTPDDYLMAAGHPAIIALCAGVLLRKFDSINMLQWHRQNRTYIHLEINP